MAGRNQDQQQSDTNNTPGSNEQFCESCGSVISTQADLCPDCGAPQSSGGQAQATSQDIDASGGNERAFKQAIDDKKVEGWDVKSREGDRVILIKRGFGTLGSHVLVAILTAWWTAFLGNAVYAAYKYFIDTDRMVIRKSEFTA